MLLCLVGTPTGTAKTNTNDTIIVTTMATDQDANDTLTYTLWWGDSSGNLSKTNVTATGRSGQSVTLERSGLSNDTRYWFKVVVSDSIDEATSGEGNEKTYCKGEYCSGVSYTNVPCTKCKGNGQIVCLFCNGDFCRAPITFIDAVYHVGTSTIHYSCTICNKLTNGYYYTLTWECRTCGGTGKNRNQFCSYDCTKSYASHGFAHVPPCSYCENGIVTCPSCEGSKVTIDVGPCIAHSMSNGHYYCTSLSHHGDNITQYHK